jgi:transposase
MDSKQYFPEIVEKSETEIAAIIDAIENCALPDSIKQFAIRSIKVAVWFPLFLQQKNISLDRLRKIIFGKGYRKKSQSPSVSSKIENNGHSSVSDGLQENHNVADMQPSHAPPPEASNTSDKQEHSKKPGHGRMPHTVYKDYEEIYLPVIGLQVGDLCPLKCGGKLRPYDAGILIRIKGQNFARVIRYTLEKLRCDLCGTLFSGITEDVGKEKYDASFKAILAILKYYVAVPFYRQEYFQKLLDFPLSDATQWDLIEQQAGYYYPVFNQLKLLAAHGTLLHHDDTTLKILEVIKQIKTGMAGHRTGMYTTGMVVKYGNHKIALFINGRQHSGENVSDILKQRDTTLPPIIQMCDALSANIPAGLQTILCNCLSHGFRKFEELVNYFPEECMMIIKWLGQVYDVDEKTRTMSDIQRLTYHQENSGPVMDTLARYIQTLLDERRIEPNSEMGKAIKYMQKHWAKLTRFLTVAGAPIDNNIVERALKIPIRNRKSAMFYKTCYSAQIGGMITSLIYTCHLSNENAHHYLTGLQQYPEAVRENPSAWLPWNYRKNNVHWKL